MTAPADRLPEPWLRGPIDDVPPCVMPLFFCFAQVREDLEKNTVGLPAEAVWRKFGNVSLGFHLKHLAGSVDRLTTYLQGRQISRQQLNALHRESEPDKNLDELLDTVRAQLEDSETQLRTLDQAALYDRRSVGRQALPTTVLGLLVHLCEHTQRHLGQAILLANLLR